MVFPFPSLRCDEFSCLPDTLSSFRSSAFEIPNGDYFSPDDLVTRCPPWIKSNGFGFHSPPTAGRHVDPLRSKPHNFVGIQLAVSWANIKGELHLRPTSLILLTRASGSFLSVMHTYLTLYLTMDPPVGIQYWNPRRLSRSCPFHHPFPL